MNSSTTHHARSASHQALLDRAGFKSALVESFVKLAPKHAFSNPVMAVVWLGTVLTAVLTVTGVSAHALGLTVTVLLFVTVLFANFAEAVAEARGRGQAASLEKQLLGR